MYQDYFYLNSHILLSNIFNIKYVIGCLLRNENIMTDNIFSI